MADRYPDFDRSSAATYADHIEKLRNEQMSGSAIAGGKIAPAEVGKGPPSTLDEIADHILNAASRVGTVLNRISRLGDRAYGTQPECNEADERREPSCAVERVFTCLDDLQSVLTRLESAQSRIDGIA